MTNASNQSILDSACIFLFTLYLGVALDDYRAVGIKIQPDDLESQIYFTELVPQFVSFVSSLNMVFHVYNLHYCVWSEF